MNVKELRSTTGLSQSQFAKKYNIKLQTLQSWEAERRNPPDYSLKMLEKIVKEDLEKRELP